MIFEKALPKLSKKSFLMIVVILLSFFIRVWRLDKVPSVINGDESGSIIYPLQIILGRSGNPFDLTMDGSVSYIVFYLKALSISFLGLANSLLAVRLVTVILSTLALIPFFLIVSSHFSILVSFLITLAFACNYWYLNFSRLSWINIDGVFCGLWLLYFAQKAVEKKEFKYFVLSGLFSALVLYNYQGIRIYFLVVVLFFLLWVIFERKRKFLEKFKRISLYFLVVLVLFLPQLVVIKKNSKDYFARAANQAIFRLKDPYYGYQPSETQKILLHQLDYTLKGFILFDSSVSGEGIENRRYLPRDKGAVNLVVRIFFWFGVLVSIFKKKKSFIWWVILLFSLIFLQVPSVFIPNWSRGIGVLPIIYLFTGLGLEELYLFFKVKKVALVFFIISLIFMMVSASDVFVYWRWVNGEDFKSAQPPTILVEELEGWQKAQIDWMKKGHFPFNFYEWHDPKFRQERMAN